MVTKQKHQERAAEGEAAQHAGMGATPHDDGTTFRVWAPFADSVAVVGEFNDWNQEANPLSHEGNGYWATDVPEAKLYDEYKYIITNGDHDLYRIDPYSRKVTHSAGNTCVTNGDFEWDDEGYEMPSWNEVIIYEMHIGTFADEEEGDGERGDFRSAINKLPYLEDLGITAIEIMPPMEFAVGTSWGYNVAHPFAIEGEYGGPEALKEFVNAAHQHGLAVILDVVYNHFGPSDLDLWRFDGWYKDDYGGIYFYNDWRAETPWGKTRPDYGREEVRQYLRDNAMMWIAEYHLDGLRWDSTAYIRHVHGDNGDSGAELPDGWSLMQRINREMQDYKPSVLSIAEDMKQKDAITASVDEGGAGFGSQWTPYFAQKVRPALTATDDASRDLESVRDGILNRLGEDAFHRVIYTESHDEVANGKARLAEEIWPANARHWFSKKRTTLGAVLVFTSPGIPMLFQGQEFMEDRWFDDHDPLDWHLVDEVPGIVQLYKDLIWLRLDGDEVTRGLQGQNVEVHHLNSDKKIIAFQRWEEGGPRDSVVVVTNFSNQSIEDYNIGFPRAGLWKLRFDSHGEAYDPDFDGQVSTDVEAKEESYDGLSAKGSVAVAPYSAIILSQDE